MTTPDTRPTPVTDALRAASNAVAAAVAVVSALGSAGVFSAAQVDTVTSYGEYVTEAVAPDGAIAIIVGAVVGLISGASTKLAIQKAGKGATAQTTPLTAPQDHDGTPLVRADGLPLGGDRRSPADTPTTQTDMRGV